MAQFNIIYNWPVSLLLFFFFFSTPVWRPFGSRISFHLCPGNGWPMRSRHPMTTSTLHPFLPTRSLYNRYLSLKAFLSCSSSLLDWSSSLSGHYLLASGSVTQKKKENLFSSCRAESNSGRYRSHDFPTVRGCDGQQNVVYIYIYVYVYRSKQPSTQPKSG